MGIISHCNESLKRLWSQKELKDSAAKKIFDSGDVVHIKDSPVGYSYIPVDNEAMIEIQDHNDRRGAWFKQAGADAIYMGLFDSDQDVVDWLNWFNQLEEK